MRNLIKLIEDFDTDNDGDHSMDRETHIIKLIHYAFGKVGLAISHDSYSVNYSDDTREAEVTLEDVSIALSTLLALNNTGLSHDFKIEHGHDALRIAFTVVPEMDYAKISHE